jgi:hypothetical protein
MLVWLGRWMTLLRSNLDGWPIAFTTALGFVITASPWPECPPGPDTLPAGARASGAPQSGVRQARAGEADLTRSERRSWQLHRRVSSQLTRTNLQEWRPTIEGNLARLRDRVTGQPHRRNLDRWTSLVDSGDVLGLHRVLTGLDRDSIEMREVSPMGGLLSQDDRAGVLAAAR